MVRLHFLRSIFQAIASARRWARDIFRRMVAACCRYAAWLLLVAACEDSSELPPEVDKVRARVSPRLARTLA